MVHNSKDNTMTNLINLRNNIQIQILNHVNRILKENKILKY